MNLSARAVPAVVGVSTPTLLFYLVIELLVISGWPIFIFYVVRRYSGLNDPDIISDVWSRIGEIRLQPISHVLLYSAAISYGFSLFFSSVLQALPILLNLDLTKVGILFSIIGLAVVVTSSAVAVTACRVGGSQKWVRAVFGLFCLETFVSVIAIAGSGMVNVIKEQLRQQGIEIGTFELCLILYLLSPLASGCVQLLSGYWAKHWNVPSPAREMHNTVPTPPSATLWVSILISSAPLLMVYMATLLIQLTAAPTNYLARCVSSLSVLVLLAASGIAAVFSVKRGLLAGENAWHWRAFLVPAVPLTFTAFVASVAIGFAFGKEAFLEALLSAFGSFFAYGFSGVLSVYIYFWAAEKHLKRDGIYDPVADSPGLDV